MALVFATPAFAEIDISEAERAYVAQVVECEAGAEPLTGKIMIANSIRDYAEDHGISIWNACKALQVHTYTRTVTENTEFAVHLAYDNGVRITQEHTYWWYNPDLCTSSWHESQDHVITIAHHKFFGPWN